jgi:hypothetical protein
MQSIIADLLDSFHIKMYVFLDFLHKSANLNQ